MTVLSIAVLIYAGFCLFMYTTQRNAIYYPTPEAHMPEVEDLRLESDGETLKIWRIAHADGASAIIYFGGNAEDVSGNIADFRFMFPQHNVYLVNYRGYGGSTGAPTELGLYTDALAVFDEIASRYTNIAVIGRSLGSGVAIHLAAQRKLEKLVMVTPFDSIEVLAKESLPIFPISLLLKDKYRSIDLAPGIETPTLVLIAERDGVIPRNSTDRLIAAFDAARVVTHVLEEATHNTVGGDPEYLSRLQLFLDD